MSRGISSFLSPRIFNKGGLGAFSRSVQKGGFGNFALVRYINPRYSAGFGLAGTIGASSFKDFGLVKLATGASRVNFLA